MENILLTPALMVTASIVSAVPLIGIPDGLADMVTGEHHYLLKKMKLVDKGEEFS